MLQRIHDTVGTWVAVLVLGLITAGFVFWRADYGGVGRATYAAKVNGESVSIDEFDRELQARQNQFQQQYRTELTDDMRKELRRSVVERMVNDEVLKQRVEQQHYRVSDERLSDWIRSVPAFQVDGQYDDNVAMGLLRNQGINPEAFKASQRQSMEVLELQAGIADSTFLTPAEFRRYIELASQRREIAYGLFAIDAFLATATVDEAAIAAHYESNKDSYKTTETVDFEYVDLSVADIAAKISVTDDDLRTLYEQERERFQTVEDRHARHILIAVQGDDEAAARAKAESAEARLRNGEDFAAVAKDMSDDAGTKAQGGDLGWMSRGDGGPFEDALFGLKVGEVSAPVRSDFGFHIIRLDELRPGQEQPFESVRDQLASEYRTREAEREFDRRANKLTERAFDAYNELATVATEMDVPLKTAKDFPRTGDPALFENSAPVVQAAFADETVDSGRNSQLVELAPDRAMVLRVTAHRLPEVEPLEKVHDRIKEQLTRARAQELAEAAAQAFLQDLEQGKDPAQAAAAHSGVWHAPAFVERGAGDVPAEVLSAAFALPRDQVNGAKHQEAALADGGHAVFMVSKVEPGEATSVPQDERDQRQQDLAQQSALAELTSYAGNLRRQATVTIPPEVLTPTY
ncbi:MAG TPA: SurA N-terminal domain-containing protein [Gammaproteobacteria bacterium]|nr:SurA N-terminal domain-containing protein [Gammaproteobacteria bacterium]